jgi:integrase
MKATTGSIVKRKPRRKGAKATWWARVTYVDPRTGKHHVHVAAFDHSRRRPAVPRGSTSTKNPDQIPTNDSQRQSRALPAPADAECGLTRRLDSSKPFTAGDSLISLADENKRERILTREEEIKLLAACETPQRAHLKAILICALDTGMRQGEIFSLRWRDVDLENGLLTIQASHSKTMKERQVALTARVSLELERLKAKAPDNPNGLVFGILDNVKRSFTSARSDAGLKDVRFHDLRHYSGNAPCRRAYSALGGWPRLGPHSGQYDLSLRQRKRRDGKAGGSGAGRIQYRKYGGGDCGRIGALNQKQC